MTTSRARLSTASVALAIVAILAPARLAHARYAECVDSPPSCSTHPSTDDAFCAPWDEGARTIGNYVDASCAPCSLGECTGTSEHGTTYVGHDGLDVGWRAEDPVLAVAGGVVVCVLREDDEWWRTEYLTEIPESEYTDLAAAANRRPFGDDRGYGNHVIVRTDAPGGTYYTLYGHLAGIHDDLSPGTCIGRGERIAEGVSLTGNTTGLHLHLEVRSGSNSSCNAFEPYSIPLWSSESPICSEGAASLLGCAMRRIDPAPDPARPIELAPGETFLYQLVLGNRGRLPWDATVPAPSLVRSTRVRVRVVAEDGVPMDELLPEAVADADGAMVIPGAAISTPFEGQRPYETLVRAPSAPGVYRVQLVTEISLTEATGDVSPFAPIGGEPADCVAPISIVVRAPPDPDAPAPDPICTMTVGGVEMAAADGACVQAPDDVLIGGEWWGGCSWFQCQAGAGGGWSWRFRGGDSSFLDPAERAACASLAPASDVLECRMEAGASLFRTCEACAGAAEDGWPVTFSRASQRCAWCDEADGAGGDGGASGGTCGAGSFTCTCEPNGTLVPGDGALGHGGNLVPSDGAGYCDTDERCCDGGECTDGRCVVIGEAARCVARDATCDESTPCCGDALCTSSPGTTVRRCRGLEGASCRSASQCAGGMTCDEASGACEAGEENAACTVPLALADVGSLSELHAASSFECADGLFCGPAASTAGTRAESTCRRACDFLGGGSAPPCAEGASCPVPEGSCGAGQVCQPVGEGAMGLCAPCGAGVDGAPCAPSCDAAGACPPDLSCRDLGDGARLCVGRCGEGLDACPDGTVCRPGGVCLPCEGAVCRDSAGDYYCAGDGARICGYGVRTYFNGSSALQGWIYCSESDPGAGWRRAIECTCDDAADLMDPGSCFDRALVAYGGGVGGYEGGARCEAPGACEEAFECSPAGGACGHYRECCGGLDCSEANVCTCRPAGERCNSDGICCAGACSDGFCECRGEGQSCGSASECCGGLACLAGACRSTEGCGLFETACTEQAECCFPLRCRDAAWGGASECCLAGRVACDSSDECCGAMECVGGQCACRAAGESCANGLDCCEGSSCMGGACVAT